MILIFLITSFVWCIFYFWYVRLRWQFFERTFNIGLVFSLFFHFTFLSLSIFSSFFFPVWTTFFPHFSRTSFCQILSFNFYLSSVEKLFFFFFHLGHYDRKIHVLKCQTIYCNTNRTVFFNKKYHRHYNLTRSKRQKWEIKRRRKEEDEKKKRFSLDNFFFSDVSKRYVIVIGIC